MLVIILFMSLLFIGIGFVLTEGNAKYLLAGYNTLSTVEQEKIDLKEFLSYFRKFHLILGTSFLLIGVILFQWVGTNAAGIFLAVYPILAYIYFISKSANYTNSIPGRRNKFGLYVLIGALVLVVGLFVIGFNNDQLILGSESVEIEGIYGETILMEEIESVELVDQLPKINLKTNGFALGSVNKGYFRTESGEVVKLILNSNEKPVLLLVKKDGAKVYYGISEEMNKSLYERLSSILR